MAHSTQDYQLFLIILRESGARIISQTFIPHAVKHVKIFTATLKAGPECLKVLFLEVDPRQLSGPSRHST